jgi:DNA-binding transcriptional LysR family regulator
VQGGSGAALEELRVGDLTTFLAVRAAGSVSQAARATGVTPSQVSKAIARLEGALRVRLLTRGARGVALSEEGRRLAPQVEEAVARLRALQRTEPASSQELTIAAPSWLGMAIVPRVAFALGDPAGAAERGHAAVRVRGIELPPALVRAYAAENIFDLALLPGTSTRLPAAWQAVEVGSIRKALFASRAVAKSLGAFPVTPQRLRGVPFIAPVYNADGTFVPVDDDCPMPRGERTVGHEAQTFGLGLELALRCDQLVYGPVLAAGPYLARGDLVEIPVRGWDEHEPLHVACDAGRVLARVQNAVAKAVKDALAELDAEEKSPASGRVIA